MLYQCDEARLPAEEIAEIYRNMAARRLSHVFCQACSEEMKPEQARKSDTGLIMCRPCYMLNDTDATQEDIDQALDEDFSGYLARFKQSAIPAGLFSIRDKPKRKQKERRNDYGKSNERKSVQRRRDHSPSPGLSASGGPVRLGRLVSAPILCSDLLRRHGKADKASAEFRLRYPVPLRGTAGSFIILEQLRDGKMVKNIFPKIGGWLRG